MFVYVPPQSDLTDAVGCFMNMQMTGLRVSFEFHWTDPLAVQMSLHLFLKN